MGPRLSAAREMPGVPEPGSHRRSDPFAELVRTVAADPQNPYNIEGYLWVLEDDPPRPCACCGRLFDTGVGYRGELARGLPRRYCTLPCSRRAAWQRRTDRWGRAA